MIDLLIVSIINLCSNEISKLLLNDSLIIYQESIKSYYYGIVGFIKTKITNFSKNQNNTIGSFASYDKITYYEGLPEH